MGAAQPRKPHSLFGAPCPSCAMEYTLVALLGRHGWWWGCFLEEGRDLSGGVCISVCHVSCVRVYWESKCCLSRVAQALKSTLLPVPLSHCPWRGPAGTFGFCILGLPPSPNFLQRFALQTGSSWHLKLEWSGSSCPTKPWKLVDSEMYPPRKCERAPAAALIPNWRPPQAFVTSLAEMQPGPLRNRVITYLGAIRESKLCNNAWKTLQDERHAAD